MRKSKSGFKVLLFVAMASTLTACGSIGNMSAVKEGIQYAIDCEPDKALSALDKAASDGGLSGYMGQLERIVVLEDAGRSAAAAKALEDYMKLPEVEESTRSEVDDSIQNSLDELRKEREKQTGKRNC